MHNSQDFQILSMLIDLVRLIINRIERIREKFNSREKENSFLDIKRHEEKKMDSENCTKH